MSTVKRIFCEIGPDLNVRFSKDAPAKSLAHAEKYTEMPASLHHLYEMAFYQLPGWKVKLCGLSDLGGSPERLGMLVSTTGSVPESVSHSLLDLAVGIEDFSSEEATTFFVPAGLNEAGLAAVLFFLHTRKTLDEFASATYEADPPVGAVEVWYRLAKTAGLPKAFNPGISEDLKGQYVYIRFYGTGQASGVVQQEGWRKDVADNERARSEMVVKLSTRALEDRFSKNLVIMANFLQTRLAELTAQAKENRESISWRNLVLRLFNSELPGYWDTAELRDNVIFTLEVHKK